MKTFSFFMFIFRKSLHPDLRKKNSRNEIKSPKITILLKEEALHFSGLTSVVVTYAFLTMKFLLSRVYYRFIPKYCVHLDINTFHEFLNLRSNNC